MFAGPVAALVLLARPAVGQPAAESPDSDGGGVSRAEPPPAQADSDRVAAPASAESETLPSTEDAPPAVDSDAAATQPEESSSRSYYTEPPRAGGDPDRKPRPTAAPPVIGVYEPPPPGMGPVYEPPPPEKPVHVAPKNALWVGARVGLWIPFGGAWGRCTVYYADTCAGAIPIPLRDFVTSGPMLQVDLGARVGRLYNVFFSWEHAELGGGAASLSVELPDDTMIEQSASSGGRTDFYALGARFSSDADRVGFLAEILLGFRNMVVNWDTADVPTDGIQRLQMGQAPLEFRFGLGADIRLAPLFSLSPMFTVGSGRFGNVEQELDDGSKQDALGSSDVFATHGWFTFNVGGHFDLFGQ
jgi:hypothetical protein